MSELEKLRQRIDELDLRLVELLSERLRLAGEIGVTKEEAGLSVYDPDRERRVLERVVKVAGGTFPPTRLRAIFREIISASRAEEQNQTVLVHGEWASLAHYAAFLRFGASTLLEPASRAEDLFARLTAGTCGYAIVSLEGHSLETSLDRLDLFLHSEVTIFGEFYVRPKLGLYGLPAAKVFEPVFGTAGAMVQASRWIARQPPEREFRVVGSTAEALRQVRATGGLVLGHPILETLEGLKGLEDEIEDLPDAARRFLVLSKRQAAATGHDKTSVLAVIPNRPGALHEVTGILSRAGINLSWIEPKATHLGAWDHLFVVELEGHREEERVARALGEMKEAVELLRVLGSYPSEVPPERSGS